MTDIIEKKLKEFENELVRVYRISNEKDTGDEICILDNMNAFFEKALKEICEEEYKRGYIDGVNADKRTIAQVVKEVQEETKKEILEKINAHKRDSAETNGSCNSCGLDKYDCRCGYWNICIDEIINNIKKL